MFRFRISALILVIVVCISVWAYWEFRRAENQIREMIAEEPSAVFVGGRLEEYTQAGVYTEFKDPHAVWLVRLPEGKLVAIRSICTHLGCTPDWHADEKKFHCPCHGSEFDMNGLNISGPAKRPLERHKIYLDGETIMVDKSTTFRGELDQWAQADSFVLPRP